MKRPLYFTLSLMVIVNCSCGPSAADIAAQQKRHDDSLAREVRINTQRRDDSIAAAKANSQETRRMLQAEIAQVKNALEHANADLAVANDEMNSIKGFQLGRTHSERETQIRNQTLKIQRLQDGITHLQQLVADKQTMLASLQ